MNTKYKFLIFLALLLIACSNKYSQQKTAIKFQLNQKVNGKVFMVKDTTLYSPEFINELRQLSPEYDTLILVDENIIITSRPFNGKEYISATHTTKIPLLFPINTPVNYHLENENQIYSLILKRTNYTNLRYELKSNSQIIKDGQAILPGGFILGSETDEDENGIMYGAIDYIDKTECWTRLRIELSTGKSVSISIFCDNDTTRNIHITQLKK